MAWIMGPWAVLILVGIAVTGTAGASDGLLVNQSQWKRLDVPGEEPARFRFSRPGELSVDADNAVAFLYRPISAPGNASAEQLSWR